MMFCMTFSPQLVCRATFECCKKRKMAKRCNYTVLEEHPTALHMLVHETMRKLESWPVHLPVVNKEVPQDAGLGYSWDVTGSGDTASVGNPTPELTTPLSQWVLGSPQLLLTLWVLGSSQLLLTPWMLGTIRVGAVP